MPVKRQLMCQSMITQIKNWTDKIDRGSEFSTSIKFDICSLFGFSSRLSTH